MQTVFVNKIFENKMKKNKNKNILKVQEKFREHTFFKTTATKIFLDLSI